MRVHPNVAERLERLEIPFNRSGIDPYGVSREHLARAYGYLRFFYQRYFRVRTHGIEHVPARGRVMLVGNHSGGYAVDAAMLISACFFDMDPPRLAQGMVDKFLNRLPFASSWSNKTGHFTGIPEHASRLLRDDRMLVVFPEGVRGTAKLYRARHSLVRFGTGFVRLAIETQTPIVPVAILGGGEAVPTIANFRFLGRLFGVPYMPITPYLAPIPLPVRIQLYFGEPLRFDGDGAESDAVIESHVERVKAAIAELMERGRQSQGET
jgi:1-acyl-sn-glycerol-3-phosphate acyltransferase